ncbi:MAG: hypothetical protein OXU79_08100 [Gemmatimonadota bacterium]|nr:hypothetical protein [Gemmatimonadota bacterium]
MPRIVGPHAELIQGTSKRWKRLKVIHRLPQETLTMPGIVFRTLSVVASVLFFAEPAVGAPPAPADSLKIRPPHGAKGPSGLERLKGLKQRLARKRQLEKQPLIFALEKLLVPRSPMDNMPIANPGAGFAFNMPIAMPDPNVNYKLHIIGTPSVPTIIESIRPQSRKPKPK